MDYKKIFNEAKLKEARPEYEDERLQWVEKPEDADQYDDWVRNTDNWSDTCGGRTKAMDTWDSQKRQNAVKARNQKARDEWHGRIDNALNTLDRTDPDFEDFLGYNGIKTNKNGKVIGASDYDYWPGEGTPADIDDNPQKYFDKYKRHAQSQRNAATFKASQSQSGEAYINDYFGVENGAEYLKALLDIKTYKEHIATIEQKINDLKSKAGVSDEDANNFDEDNLVKYLQQNGMLGPKAKKCSSILKSIDKHGYGYKYPTMELH